MMPEIGRRYKESWKGGRGETSSLEEKNGEGDCGRQREKTYVPAHRRAKLLQPACRKLETNAECNILFCPNFGLRTIKGTTIGFCIDSIRKKTL
jgi:hypothetical protein